MPSDYHIFLSYHSPDRAAVEHLARQLEERGLRVWLDVWRLRPGLPWRRELEKQIENVDAAAVIVGASGIGPWQDEEVDAVLQAFVDRGCPVIPVILADAGEAPDLPSFLRNRTWVDYRQTDRDPLDRLVWGITGEEPTRPTPTYADDATQQLSETLDRAYRSKAELEAAGDDTSAVTEEILSLRRRLREGAQLKAGDFLLDGRFQLLEMIGQGGFAQVWKAYDQTRRALVAVKVLHGQHTGDASRRERFFRGARQMAQLTHPNVVRVIEEKCEDGEYPFFAMEYLAGGDFRRAVLEDRLSQAERLEIILEIGEALTLAHERGVVHRDVKPHNILLTLDGTPKLTDFDLVRAADTTGGTRTSMLGTFLYAAPEAMVDARQAAASADVYGLGMTALFALHGLDLPSDVLWELTETIDQLDVNDHFRQVLLQALARKVKERWSTVEDFCGALRHAINADLETTPTLEASSAYRSTGIRIHKIDGSTLVLVPEGEFILGEGNTERRLALSDYWIGKHPVTNDQYQKFAQATGHRKPLFWEVERFNHPRQPVVGVSWHDAMAYCAWAGLELPSEDHWEAAARGIEGRPYPWGDTQPTSKHADFGKTWDSGKPDTVGSHPLGASPYGAQDQVGGVWEWCVDALATDFNRMRFSHSDPRVMPDDHSSKDAERVVRGGSWDASSRYLRAAFRSGLGAGDRLQLLGFRVLFRSGSGR
ncbi:MAG: SUMF1/EgtB/PvdO family nonheme iron enzyme [Acidobacteriota bacterium]